MEERLAVGEIARYALKRVNILKNTNKHIPAKDIIEIIERGCDKYKIPMSNIDISFSIDGGLMFFKLDSYLKSFIEDKNIIDVAVSARNNEINKTVVYFVAKPISSDIKMQESEISNIKWFDFDEALETITYDDNKNILREVLKNL